MKKAVLTLSTVCALVASCTSFDSGRGLDVPHTSSSLSELVYAGVEQISSEELPFEEPVWEELRRASFATKAVARTTRWFFKQTLQEGGYRLMASGTNGANLYVVLRYSYKGKTYYKYYRSQGSFDQAFSFAPGVGNVFGYVRALSGQVLAFSLEEQRAVPLKKVAPVVTSSPSTVDLSLLKKKMAQVQKKGYVPLGSVVKRGDGYYQQVKKGATYGRIYWQLGASRAFFVEGDLMIAFEHAGGVERYGYLRRDGLSFTLYNRRTGFVYGTKATYLHNFSADRGFSFTETERGVVFGHFARFGIPEEVRGAVVRMTKGFVHLDSRQADYHRSFQWPVGGWYPISQKYHGDVYNAPKKHVGIDIATPMHTPIYAAANAVVEEVTLSLSRQGWGKAVKLRHFVSFADKRPVFTIYAHCDDVLVKKGDWVMKGELIARSGNTGNVNVQYKNGYEIPGSGAHLHFAVLDDRVRGFGPGYLLYPSDTDGHYDPSDIVYNSWNYF